MDGTVDNNEGGFCEIDVSVLRGDMYRSTKMGPQIFAAPRALKDQGRRGPPADTRDQCKVGGD